MKTLFTTAALFILFLAVGVALFKTTKENTGPPPKITADVWTRASAADQVPVIIRLDLGVDPATLSGPDLARAIEQASNDVIARVPADQLVPAHRYQIVPILAAWVTYEGLFALQGTRSASRVILDRPLQAALKGSTARIAATNLWPLYKGRDRLVAVLDTGIHLPHPFIANRVPYEACFRMDKLCPGGRYDMVGPGAAFTLNRKHGPHVAGIVAGADGVSGTLSFNGVAPGANIIAINVFSDGGTYVADQIKALEHVAFLKAGNSGIVAANISVEDGGRYTAACDVTGKDMKFIIDKLYAAGVATVVAAGNSGYRDAVAFPGCISSALTVSSVDDNGAFVVEHNRSSLTDFLAPGKGVLSSKSHAGAYVNNTPDYIEMSGTSMAAPHVAGAIALLSEAESNASVDRIVGALRTSAINVKDPLTGKYYRQIDLGRALATLRQH